MGATIDAFGLDGLIRVHVALGAVAWLFVDAWHHAHPEQEETLS